MWISWFTACIAMANSVNMAGAMQIHRNTETERDSIQEHNAWNIVINTQRNQNLTLFFSVPLLADLLHLCLIVLNIPEMEHTSLDKLNIQKKGFGNVSAALFCLGWSKVSHATSTDLTYLGPTCTGFPSLEKEKLILFNPSFPLSVLIS